MYELMRRVKLQLRKVLEAGSVTSIQNIDEEERRIGPGGCQISTKKFRRLFPQIDIKKMDEASLVRLVLNDIDPCDEMLEELGGPVK